MTKEELENPWLLYLKDVDLGGKIVLDPMMGGGTTIIEPLRFGCKVFAQDLNPVAWFLVRKMAEPVDINLLKSGFRKLEQKVADEIKKYYRTLCPNCLKEYCENNKRNSNDIIKEVLSLAPKAFIFFFAMASGARGHGFESLIARRLFILPEIYAHNYTNRPSPHRFYHHLK